MNFIGKITEINGRYVTVKVDDLLSLGLINSVNDDENPEVDVTVVDKRLISPVQRRKTYAILRDMSDFFGYTLDEMKNVMKGLFYETMDAHEFSLGNTDITTARTFISFLLEFALKYHIPMRKPALEYQDDLDVYMYQSLKNRSCVICGLAADVHHVDTVGMGNDRRTVDHREKHLIALCRAHHNEAHNIGWPVFAQKYHVKGIKLDPETLQRLGIMTFKRMEEIDGTTTNVKQESY